jgi:hypothetical protein
VTAALSQLNYAKPAKSNYGIMFRTQWYAFFIKFRYDLAQMPLNRVEGVTWNHEVE